MKCMSICGVYVFVDRQQLFVSSLKRPFSRDHVCLRLNKQAMKD